MNYKLFSILLIISVYSEAKKVHLKRHKIQLDTLEESIRNQGGNDADAKLKRSDVNLEVDVTFVISDKNNVLETKTEPLAIETTSSDLWVISTSCKSAFCTKNKKNANGIDGNQDKESTAENGLVRGKFGILPAMIDDYLTGTVNFTSADYVDRAVEKRLSPSAAGALGLGPSSTLLKAISPQNIIALTVTPSEGDLYIDEIPNFPPNGKKTRIMSMSQSTWKISLGYISSSIPPIKNWCFKGCVAEIDSTFAGISGPAKDINDLNAYLGADEDGSIDCYKMKLIDPLVFHINGQRYRLEAKNFIIQEDREKDPFSNKCKTQFQVEYSNNGAWRLGLAFLQQFTTVFEYSHTSSYNYISFIQNR